MSKLECLKCRGIKFTRIMYEVLDLNKYTAGPGDERGNWQCDNCKDIPPTDFQEGLNEAFDKLQKRGLNNER